MSTQRAYTIIGIMFISVLLLRLPEAPTPIFGVDEAHYAVIASTILDGGMIYRDSFEHKGPITHFLTALIFFLFGRNNMTALHVAVIGMVLLITLILFQICRRIDPSLRTGCWAVGFMSIFSYTYPKQDMFIFQSEWVAAVFTSLGAYILIRSIFTERPFSLVWSGLFYGLAFLTKQTTLLDFGVALGLLVLQPFFIGTHKLEILKSVGWMLLGFVLVVGLMVAYFYAHQALNDFWFGFWEYNMNYYMAKVSWGGRIASALATVISDPDSYLQVNFLLLLLFVSGFCVNVYQLVQNQRKDATDWVNLFLVGWGVSSYLEASFSGRNFGYYYIIILPAFCLVSAQVTETILIDLSTLKDKTEEVNTAFSKGKKGHYTGFPSVFSKEKASKSLFKGLTLQGQDPCQRGHLRELKIFVLTVFLWGMTSPLATYVGERKIWRFYLGQKMYSHHVSAELKMLIDYMRQNSRKEDKIFVWGFYEDIYVLAERKPASRYINCLALTGYIPEKEGKPLSSTRGTIVPGSWDILMEELRTQRPLFIVDTSFGHNTLYDRQRRYGHYPLEQFERLYNFLQEHYFLDREFFFQSRPTFRLFKRKLATDT